MEFQSDFSRIQNLLNTEEITNVEFSEDDVSDRNKRNNWNRQDKKDMIEQTDEYDKQNGGAGDNLNYLDDYTSSQYKSQKLDSYEKDFYNIFNKAREYRKRVLNVQNRMDGGQDSAGPGAGEKKKRPVNKTLGLMLEMTKKMKDSGKYKDIQQKHFMKISKLILDQAKKDAGSTDINDAVRRKALELADRPDDFVARFRREQKEQNEKQAGESNSAGNYRSRRISDNDNDSFRDGSQYYPQDSNYRNWDKNSRKNGDGDNINEWLEETRSSKSNNFRDTISNNGDNNTWSNNVRSRSNKTDDNWSDNSRNESGNTYNQQKNTAKNYRNKGIY